MFMKNFGLFTLLIVSSFFTNCKEKGCTDPKASNFSYDAEKDDGSCEYLGCTDPDAFNYDEDAETDNGSCLYYGEVRFYSTRTDLSDWQTYIAVEVNDGYIGNITSPCTSNYIDCFTDCDYALQTRLEPGIYNYRAYVIRQTSTTNFDTLTSYGLNSFSMKSGDCLAVTL